MAWVNLQSNLISQSSFFPRFIMGFWLHECGKLIIRAPVFSNKNKSSRTELWCIYLSLYSCQFTHSEMDFRPPTRLTGAPCLSLGQVSLQESWKPQALAQPQLSQLTTNPCVWYIRRCAWLCSAGMYCPFSCQVSLFPSTISLACALSCSCCSPEDYAGVHGIYLIVFN